MHERYEPVIGLEIHCRLRTRSKAFSPEPARYGAPPNTQVHPLTLGHPGTLPVLNRRALEQALRLVLALGCTPAEQVVFARKHYFYPDLPKGYQITQYDTPLGYDGYVEIEREEGEGDGRAAGARRIGLRRVHIEEDTGKLVHDRAAHRTLVDYNRCGVPLVEIVTAPDMRSPREAALLLQKVRQLVRYLGVSDGNMEEGALRCDANVSVRQRGRGGLGTKTELKNLNSFRHVEHALAHEIARQMAVIEQGGALKAETRTWDEAARETHRLRLKETARDYRYFPEPDLPPVAVDAALLDRLRAELPERPAERRQRFIDEIGLPAYDAGVLTAERAVADYFEEAVDALYKRTRGGNTRAQAKAVGNVVMTDVLRALSARDLDVSAFPISPKRLAALVYLRLEEEVSSSAAREIFKQMLAEDAPPEEVARAQGLRQVSDREALEPVIDAMLRRHSKNVHRYRSGKKSLLRFFMGETMNSFDGAPRPQAVRRLLKEKLDG